VPTMPPGETAGRRCKFRTNGRATCAPANGRGDPVGTLTGQPIAATAGWAAAGKLPESVLYGRSRLLRPDGA